MESVNPTIKKAQEKIEPAKKTAQGLGTIAGALLEEIAENASKKFEEVKEKFDVSDTTLWLWAKKDYLVPVKVGRRVMYRASDIKRLINGH
jgi:ribosomal protein L11 methylase PrmA